MICKLTVNKFRCFCQLALMIDRQQMARMVNVDPSDRNQASGPSLHFDFFEDSPVDSTMRVWGMHKRTAIQLNAAARAELEAVVLNRNSPQKHVWRAKIVLLTADGHGSAEIMQRTGKAKTVIWRWQERFGEEGVSGLWRDKTRPSRIPSLDPKIAERVVTSDLGRTAPERDPLDRGGDGRGVASLPIGAPAIMPSSTFGGTAATIPVSVYPGAMAFTVVPRDAPSSVLPENHIRA